MPADTTSPAPVIPNTVYTNRRDDYQRLVEELDAADSRFAASRGIVFLIGLALAGFVVFGDSVPGFWLVVPLAFFSWLVVGHARVARRNGRAKRAVLHYDRGLDRLADKWSEDGSSGDRYCDPAHPYAGDLDLFGPGSLFQLLCGARTRLGEDTLAAWLQQPATRDEILERQEAANEFADRVDLCEELALLDAEAHEDFDQNLLRKWVQQPGRPVRQSKRNLATVFGLAAVVTLIGWIAGWGLSPFLSVVVVEVIFFSFVIGSIRRIGGEADEAESGLAILCQVLQLIERQSFESPLLQRLRKQLDTDGHVPSWQIARLRNRIQHLNNCLQNQFFAPIAFLLGLPIHAAHRVECWREEIGPHIPDWLRTVGQIEALCSLGRYRFERFKDVIPEIVDGEAVFDAVEIGHPLIPGDDCIRNDVRLDESKRLILVSGSNMSGKSTLLRTIGVNTVLALAGAPVRAKSLRVSRLQVGTAMRVNDSLQRGASLFYEVISRIKSIVELSGKPVTLLFLLDEILQGTNSHDRRVGAEGIIRQLVEQSAIGLVTTHDLALTSIAESFEGRAANIHFEDHLINGRMYFDYRIRQGVVKKSNALELMRMVGLEVGEDEPALEPGPRSVTQTGLAPDSAPAQTGKSEEKTQIRSDLDPEDRS